MQGNYYGGRSEEHKEILGGKLKTTGGYEGVKSKEYGGKTKEVQWVIRGKNGRVHLNVA